MPTTQLGRYEELTGASRALHERALASLPGGNSRTTVFHSPYPVYLVRGEGCRVWDADGVERLDFISNYTSLVHGHCHHKAIMTLGADVALLDGLGIEYDVPDSGCCGLAGSFGFERGDKYDVSVAAGERALLPAVRHAPRDALVITDGFSCRARCRAGPRRPGSRTRWPVSRSRS